MPFLCYPCIFSSSLSHTKSLPLNPILSSHLHTLGLSLLTKHTEERAPGTPSITLITSIYFPQVFNRLKNTTLSLSILSASLSLKAHSCSPLFFLCMLSPTVHGLFRMVHNHCQRLFLTLLLLNQIFFQFLRRNTGLKKKKHNKETKCWEKLLKIRKWGRQGQVSHKQQALAGKRSMLS